LKCMVNIEKAVDSIEARRCKVDVVLLVDVRTKRRRKVSKLVREVA
jgi:hypothetical protein